MTSREDFAEGILDRVDINSSYGDIKILQPHFLGIFYSTVLDSLVNDTLYIELEANITYQPLTRVYFEVRVSNVYFSPYNTSLSWIKIGESPAPISMEGRYIQIKAVLETSNSAYTPIIHSVEVRYRTRNPTDIDYISFIDNSFDINGYIVNYSWYMGDGSIYYTRNVTHRYLDNGTYNVVHNVTDNFGCTNSTSKQIHVENVAPLVKIRYNYSNVLWLTTSVEDFSKGYGSRVVIVEPGDVLLDLYNTPPDLIVNGREVVMEGKHYFNRVIVINGGVIRVSEGSPLIINANRIYVDARSQINADGSGYRGGSRRTSPGPGYPGEGPGGGGGGTYLMNGGGGGGGGYGGYGGQGGAGYGYPEAAPGGIPYGNPYDLSLEMGSGGGSGAYGTRGVGGYSGAGGNGGGAIFLNAFEIRIEGRVSARGYDGERGVGVRTGIGGGGGGSGGTIILRGKYINISAGAMIDVSGGNGGNPNNQLLGGGGGGGAGGRIKIFYENLIDTNTAYYYSGGQPGSSQSSPRPTAGQPGTLYKEKIKFWIYEGYIASMVKDTLYSNTTWLSLYWNATLPAGTSVEFYVRASNDPFKMDSSTPPWIYAGNSSPVYSNLPTGRYIQWMAILRTALLGVTPILHDVSVFYRPIKPTIETDIIFQSLSIDLDGYIINTTWDLGDGNISYLNNITHRYYAAGTYYVRLYVIDNDRANSVVETRVEVLG